MARKFVSYWHSGSPELEKSFSPSKTEQVGYRSVEQIVNSFMQAGQRLDDYRRGVYDFNNVHSDVDDFPDVEDINITRSPDFDEIDAQRALESVETEVKRKLKQSKKQVEKSDKSKDQNEVKEKDNNPDV